MSKNTKDRKYWISINSCQKIGSINFQKLLKYFGNLKKAWETSASELKKAGLTQKMIENLNEARNSINPDKELKKLKKLKIKTLIFEDKEYPEILKQIHDPPPVIYYKGEILPDDQLALGVVGTRKMTQYGKRACEDLVYGLAKNNFTIVSGLALGIDAIAHKTAIEAGGRTIAVLGSGLDRIYPQTNFQLAQKIIDKNLGAVISEFHPGTPSYKGNFPQRNRIISGLSQGTLVVEAALRSGALITAFQAIDQNREVFAVPGSIYSSQSQGANNIIKIGAAKAVTDYKDILDEFNLKDKIGDKKDIKPENRLEAKIIKLLSQDKALHIDKIRSKLKLEIAEISSTLTLMEIKGMIKNLGGQNYIKK